MTREMTVGSKLLIGPKLGGKIVRLVSCLTSGDELIFACSLLTIIFPTFQPKICDLSAALNAFISFLGPVVQN